MMTKVVDLFCGAGGLTYGLIQSGLNVVAGIDIEEACRFAYEHNNKAKFIAQDVSTITKEDLLELYGDVKYKILAGCAPCQPFSTYTTSLDKKNDKKWPLLYEFERLIRETQPEIVTMENVPGVTKHKVYDDFYQSLINMGYYVWASTVNCTDYGVPQNRERHVLLASKFGEIKLIDKIVENPVTVYEAISHLPEIFDGASDEQDPLHRSSRLSSINKERIIHSRQGGTWREWPEELVSECHIKDTGKGYSSVYGRMSWNKPSPTITTLCYGFGNGRFGHPEQNRAISLREAALLQSFPMDYIFAHSKNDIKMKQIGKMIGNAVPVKLGKAIGDSIVNHLQQC